MAAGPGRRPTGHAEWAAHPGAGLPDRAGSEDHALARTAALFLLGYGWNLCFVGGSGRLAGGRPSGEQARVEGAVDGAVCGGVAAIAGLVSPAVLASGGYAVLAGAAGALLVLPASVLLRLRPG